MDTELVEGSKVRVEGNEDKETAKLQSLMEVIPDEKEVEVDAIPLATKPPSIVDYKIIKEGNIMYYQIIRADGSLKRYSAFIQMLRSFDGEDLETLWKLVKAKHGSTRPEEGYERVLWGDLKTIVHFVRFQSLHVFMLVEKRYPLTPAIITKMLNKKLQPDHWNEIWRIIGIKRLLDDLRVTAAQEIKFRIELVPGAMAVAKSPYHLAPSELEELSGQLKEIKDKELFSDYDCEIRYHLGKANVVADALSRKERVKPKRVRAMNMTLQLSIKDRILVAQNEASDESAVLQKGLDEMIELRKD
ncbi:hypothetical protein Tco_0155522 [Tanacetum coccineum]